MKIRARLKSTRLIFGLQARFLVQERPAESDAGETTVVDPYQVAQHHEAYAYPNLREGMLVRQRW